MNDKFYSGRQFPLRGRVWENDELVDIKEYGIKSLTDNIFVAANGNDYTSKDFVYFIVAGDTFEELFMQMYELGFDAGKKEQIKKKYAKE